MERASISPDRSHGTTVRQFRKRRRYLRRAASGQESVHDMLRRFIRAFSLCGCVMAAACGTSASGTGLTPGFAKIAGDAHNYMKSDLIPGIGTPRFPDALAVSRAKVKIAQSKIAGDADQGVWLLLTMVNVKSNEANGAREMPDLVPGSSQVVQEAAQDVAKERDQCLSEADGWLTGTASQVRTLSAGPCLQQARLAAKILLNKGG